MSGEPHTELGDLLTTFAFTYLITTNPDAQPHVVGAVVVPDGYALRIDHTGPTTRRNIDVNPAVTLLCPPPRAGARSLIIDGKAEYHGDTVTVTPTAAILHRDNPLRPPGQRCGDECRRLSLTPPDAAAP
ncbi:pyridoxamine 5'-phosphate oxidase family protein [Nocardia sp. BMG111209]|uniref:pyridoxamine 5'-phosphate oxidase family protein n=1 Tax=Nocardia sp. BMG111209 TaxID=1160137 RepID=UPI00037E228E|nr:pyridoxamine 5'-phosphate oxidase family protein [Nocardia sp. BMG111209]